MPARISKPRQRIPRQCVRTESGANGGAFAFGIREDRPQSRDRLVVGTEVFELAAQREQFAIKHDRRRPGWPLG